MGGKMQLQDGSGSGGQVRVRFGGVIFDLDGTLLDTLTDIANAANAVLAEHKFPVHPIPDYRYMVGDGVRTLFQRILPKERSDAKTIDACLVSMKREYAHHLNLTTRPYDGVEEAIRTLRATGLRLAVLSNKDHAFTGKCVEQFFRAGTFDVVLGLRPWSQPKPDPSGALEIAANWKLSPDRIAYLGDTNTDMETAVVAGMFPIGAAWGFRSREELARHGARVIVERPAELLGVLA